MHLHGPIVRPQTDADSLFIEVTVGCTHNSCTFCNFYDGYPFRVAPLSQIEEDLAEAHATWPDAPRIWANGGNPYALSTEKLMAVGRLIRKHYPDAKVTTYARVDDLCRKSVEEMRRLAELCWDDLVVGVETGDDAVLSATNKGYTASDVLEGCRRLEEAGVGYRVIYLGGIAGKGHGVESARRTASVLNQLHPYYLYLTTVSVLPGTRLYEQRAAGEFEEQDERERLDEFMALLGALENDMGVFAAPNTTRFSFAIDLQAQKGEVIDRMRRIRDGLTEEDEARLQAYRDRMVTV